jgi:hypothetical protein
MPRSLYQVREVEFDMKTFLLIFVSLTMSFALKAEVQIRPNPLGTQPDSYLKKEITEDNRYAVANFRDFDGSKYWLDIWDLNTLKKILRLEMEDEYIPDHLKVVQGPASAANKQNPWLLKTYGRDYLINQDGIVTQENNCDYHGRNKEYVVCNEDSIKTIYDSFSGTLIKRVNYSSGTFSESPYFHYTRGWYYLYEKAKFYKIANDEEINFLDLLEDPVGEYDQVQGSLSPNGKLLTLTHSRNLENDVKVYVVDVDTRKILKTYKNALVEFLFEGTEFSSEHYDYPAYYDYHRDLIENYSVDNTTLEKYAFIIEWKELDEDTEVAFNLVKISDFSPIWKKVIKDHTEASYIAFNAEGGKVLFNLTKEVRDPVTFTQLHLDIPSLKETSFDNLGEPEGFNNDPIFTSEEQGKNYLLAFSKADGNDSTISLVNILTAKVVASLPGDKQNLGYQDDRYYFLSGETDDGEHYYINAYDLKTNTLLRTFNESSMQFDGEIYGMPGRFFSEQAKLLGYKTYRGPSSIYMADLKDPSKDTHKRGLFWTYTPDLKNLVEDTGYGFLIVDENLR